jgi:uncharacterized membrane protein YebE (DUF533 family)
LPKFNCNTPDGCACEPTAKEKRKVKINKAVFWIGLLLSIGFLSYFEYSKYNAAKQAELVQTECSGNECAPGECDSETEESSDTACDSASNCCEKEGHETTL